LQRWECNSQKQQNEKYGTAISERLFLLRVRQKFIF